MSATETGTVNGEEIMGEEKTKRPGLFAVFQARVPGRRRARRDGTLSDDRVSQVAWVAVALDEQWQFTEERPPTSSGHTGSGRRGIERRQSFRRVPPRRRRE